MAVLSFRFRICYFLWAQRSPKRGKHKAWTIDFGLTFEYRFWVPFSVAQKAAVTGLMSLKVQNKKKLFRRISK